MNLFEKFRSLLDPDHEKNEALRRVIAREGKACTYMLQKIAYAIYDSDSGEITLETDDDWRAFAYPGDAEHMKRFVEVCLEEGVLTGSITCFTNKIAKKAALSRVRVSIANKANVEKRWSNYREVKETAAATDQSVVDVLKQKAEQEKREKKATAKAAARRAAAAHDLASQEDVSEIDEKQLIVAKIMTKVSTQQLHSWRMKYNNGHHIDFRACAESFAAWWVRRNGHGLSDIALISLIRQTGAKTFRASFESAYLRNIEKTNERSINQSTNDSTRTLAEKLFFKRHGHYPGESSEETLSDSARSGTIEVS